MQSKSVWWLVAIFVGGMLFLGAIFGLVYFWRQNSYLAEALKNAEAESDFQKLIYDENLQAWKKSVIITDTLSKTLKEENAKLFDELKRKNEEVVSLTGVSLGWKGKYLGFKEATDNIKDTVIDPETGETLPAESIPTVCADFRHKVEFKKEDGYLGVEGWTLTNPAEAGMKLYWTKPLKLDIVVGKNKNGDFYTSYSTVGETDFFLHELDVRLDPSIFKKKWYQRFWVGGDLMIGRGNGMTTLNLYYEFGKVLLGPKIGLATDLKSLGVIYGAGVLWNP